VGSGGGSDFIAGVTVWPCIQDRLDRLVSD
jgi:hypothetical protein